jgi:phosphoadenosine phosphosulfate reductase
MSAAKADAAPFSSQELVPFSAKLETASAAGRVQWALDHYQPNIVLSSSFGAQAAVSLHLVTQLWADIPIILIDTGYLFPETYRFADELTARLKLNLKIYRAVERYNQRNKVEPMQRALRELGARAWITGLRRQQSSTRANEGVLRFQHGTVKIQPIVDWTDRDVYQYLKRHDLPYHPLWEKGYLSIGDQHTSRPVSEGVSEEQSRFFGLKRECGLHEDTDGSGI